MCGRYTLTWPLAAILEQLEFVPDPRLVLEPRYNIAPGSAVLAVIERRHTRFGGLMTWGLSVPWQSGSRRLINARRETLLTRPTFRSLVKRCRAIVPADGYYEWSRLTRQPYRITDPEHKLWYFAAVYRELGDHRAELAIVTTEALESVSAIHPRMPLILSASAINLWLDPDSQAYEAVLAMPLRPQLSAFRVSTAVNPASAEGPALIAPIPDSTPE